MTISDRTAEVECVVSTGRHRYPLREVKEGYVKEMAFELSPIDGGGVSQAEGGVSGLPIISWACWTSYITSQKPSFFIC